MKKLSITLAVLIAAVIGVKAQGIMSFGNDAATPITLPDGGLATTAASIWIGLFYSTVGGNANPLDRTADLAGSWSLNTTPLGIKSSAAGQFGAVTKTVTPAQGQDVWLQVRIWDKAFGSTADGYWAAVAAKLASESQGWKYFGGSPVLAGKSGGGSLPTPLLTTDFGFAGLQLQGAGIVPEPSILALGLLGGLGTLVLIRRRH